MTVDTKSVTDRRTLHFESVQDLLADIEGLAATGDIRSAGNWTPAQNVSHVADFIHASLDGMAPGPLWMRIFRLLKKSALKNTMRAGFSIPKKYAALAPDPDVTWDDALARLRGAVRRLDDGEQMNAVSPFLGPMSHDDWVKLHCRHAEMHFSFLHPREE